MVELIIGLVVGGVLGAALCALALGRRRPDGSRLADAESRAAGAEATVAGLREQLAREQEGHKEALAQLRDSFKALADDTLASVVARFNEGQVAAIKEREQRLDERLTPLKETLDQYQQKVAELETKRETGFEKVAGLAAQMLEANGGVMDETRKLATILGRASSRGRWGEVQLERIFEISDMTKHVDFEPQVTLDGGDRRGRPDAIVYMPKGARVAIDAKVPYDAYDRAIAATDDATRAAEMAQFAADVRQRILELKSRAYADQIGEPLSMVVCFIPSDQLLGAAFNADGSLFQAAIDARVLVAGPTTLIGLLRAIQLGWSQFDTVKNVAEITDLAGQLVERTAKLFELVDSLGTSLERSVKNYDKVVGSLERNLLVPVRKIQDHGVKSGTVIPEITPIDEVPRTLNPASWPNHGDDVVTVDAQVLPASAANGDALD